MTTLHAQPYNLDAIGFYFESLEAFNTQSENLTDSYGQTVEEFEIQFIDGEEPALFDACSINQANLDVWFNEVENLADHEKTALYYLCHCNGYHLPDALQKLDEVCLAENNLKNSAEELFDEIYLPDVPESVRFYIDYEKFARDCAMGGDMTEFEYKNTTWTCTNASCV